MPTEIYQEETTLFDVFQPLVLRWKFLFLGLLTGTALVAIVTLLLPKQYQTSVLLQVGTASEMQYGNFMDRQLEDSATVVEIIDSDSFRQALSSKLNREVSPRMIHVETNMVRSSPMVTVEALDDTPEHSIQLATAVADAVIARHKLLFDGKMAYFIQYSNELNTKIQESEQESEQLKKDLATFQSNKEANLSSILLLETKLNDKERQVVDWMKELRELEGHMDKVHSRNTSMVAPPVQPTKPAKPKFLLNVVIGFFGSLFLMISFILLVEQYRKTSSRIS